MSEKYIAIAIVAIFILILLLIKEREKQNEKKKAIQTAEFEKQEEIRKMMLQQKREDEEKQEQYMPYARKHLLTKTEYSFYHTLKEITDNKNCLICPKVGLKDIADITDTRNYKAYFGKISQKHVDFIICDDKLRILFAIELDDPSHEKEKVIINDEFKNRFFKTIGVPLYRIKTGYYDKETIEKTIYTTDIKLTSV